MNDKKNILVIGGAGFIGSHVCEALVKDSNIICVDNFSTSSVDNIQHLLQSSNFEFINHDITQPLDLSAFRELDSFRVKWNGIQEVYHLACPISKRNFEQFKVATVLTNSIGTKNVLDVAVNNKAKFLYASSSALYGPRRFGKDKVSEEDPTVIDHLTPYGAYDEGKRFSEAIAYTYADVNKLDVKISRIFRTYGPRMKLFDGNLIPDMINSALDGKDIEIVGSDETRLSLCYVTDIVDGLIKHMASPQEITVVNLGSDEDYPLGQVAETILRLVDSSAGIKYIRVNQPLFEAPLPNVSRAREALNWLPLVRLEDGLRQMIDYARSARQRV